MAELGRRCPTSASTLVNQQGLGTTLVTFGLK